MTERAEPKGARIRRDEEFAYNAGKLAHEKKTRRRV